MLADLRTITPQFQPFKIDPLAIGGALLTEHGHAHEQWTDAEPVVTVIVDLDHVADLECGHGCTRASPTGASPET